MKNLFDFVIIAFVLGSMHPKPKSNANERDERYKSITKLIENWNVVQFIVYLAIVPRILWIDPTAHYSIDAEKKFPTF